MRPTQWTEINSEHLKLTWATYKKDSTGKWANGLIRPNLKTKRRYGNIKIQIYLTNGGVICSDIHLHNAHPEMMGTEEKLHRKSPNNAVKNKGVGNFPRTKTANRKGGVAKIKREREKQQGNGEGKHSKSCERGRGPLEKEGKKPNKRKQRKWDTCWTRDLRHPNTRKIKQTEKYASIICKEPRWEIKQEQREGYGAWLRSADKTHVKHEDVRKPNEGEAEETPKGGNAIKRSTNWIECIPSNPKTGKAREMKEGGEASGTSGGMGHQCQKPKDYKASSSIPDEGGPKTHRSENITDPGMLFQDTKANRNSKNWYAGGRRSAFARSRNGTDQMRTRKRGSGQSTPHGRRAK